MTLAPSSKSRLLSGRVKAESKKAPQGGIDCISSITGEFDGLFGLGQGKLWDISWISNIDSVRVQSSKLPERLSQGRNDLCDEVENLNYVVCLWKVNLMMNKKGFQIFLGSLLAMKSQGAEIGGMLRKQVLGQPKIFLSLFESLLDKLALRLVRRLHR
jgi:hypothetical protein